MPEKKCKNVCVYPELIWLFFCSQVKWGLERSIKLCYKKVNFNCLPIGICCLWNFLVKPGGAKRPFSKLCRWESRGTREEEEGWAQGALSRGLESHGAGPFLASLPPLSAHLLPSPADQLSPLLLYARTQWHWILSFLTQFWPPTDSNLLSRGLISKILGQESDWPTSVPFLSPSAQPTVTHGVLLWQLCAHHLGPGQSPRNWRWLWAGKAPKDDDFSGSARLGAHSAHQQSRRTNAYNLPASKWRPTELTRTDFSPCTRHHGKWPRLS